MKGINIHKLLVIGVWGLFLVFVEICESISSTQGPPGGKSWELKVEGGHFLYPETNIAPENGWLEY